ncbi:MAG: amidohydrolase family protein [Dehalococcoidales bacterium]|nr:amidohydrolase family protein [Dehalococcoidales bacterium]
MVIDSHCHVFPPRIREERDRYAAHDRIFAKILASPRALIATADELIAGMDEDGVDTAIITGYGWATPELCRETNDYIMESIARFPRRLVGFCSVPPRSIEAAVTEIERCVKGGARGIGELRPDWQPLELAGEAAQPLIATLKKNKLIVLTHSSEPVGHIYPGKGTADPKILYELVTRLPDIPIICAHWGGGLPFYSLMPEVKRALANVYFDTAASPFLYQPEIYKQVSRLVGAEKILFGSDYPLMPQKRVLKEIDGTGLTDSERELILSGNARRLLGI